MKKTLLFTFLCGIMISCSAPKALQKGTFHNQDLNITYNKEIGEAIYSTEDLVYEEGIKILSIPDTKIFKGDYPLKPGDIIPLNKTTKKGNIYHFRDDYNITGYTVMYSKNLTKYGNFGVFVSSDNIAYPLHMQGTTPVKDNNVIQVEKAKYISQWCNSCYKKEFIYNGKNNNQLKFTYREYVNDLARPAFSQDLQYDLNESNIIGFKGLRIEVMKSSNTEIQYKVLNDIIN